MIVCHYCGSKILRSNNFIEVREANDPPYLSAPHCYCGIACFAKDKGLCVVIKHESC